MALGPRLEFRQSQSLVMTPQLLQAIKLLQLSTVELAAYVEAELERNPLLERAEAPGEPAYEAASEPAAENPREGDWASDMLATDRQAIERDLGTTLENAFPDDEPARKAADAPLDQPGFQAFDGGLRGGGSFDPHDENSLESRVSSEISLHEHLERQLAMSLADPTMRLIGEALIAAIEETGYLGEPIDDIALRLGISEPEVLAVLAVIQGFEPSGVGARNLAECLELQLRERDRLDPAMATLIAHLDLLAKRDFAALRRLCRVDDEDIADMVGEIRRLEPKPGLVFGRPHIQAVIPDVIVRAAPDQSWLVELNGAALPRVLANRAYFTRVSRQAGPAGKDFIETAWSDANWLVRSLEQRSRTILKVASEIVRQQDGFFAYGVAHLRPLNLKAIADLVKMHESTVSRVTSNKFMATPRGIFEMKYFFTAAIASSAGGEAHSAEAVRFRIKQLIEAESPSEVLSDDAIVARLKASGIEIARRTVAKYRESLRIPSSAARRREKRTLG
jgi:RNA polymerase sigma-54 factor